MRPSVFHVVCAMNRRFEGVLSYPYLDIRGLVTVGCGCLVPSLSAMQALPWRGPNGERSTGADVAHAWDELRAATYLELRGGGAFEAVTQIRLLPSDIDALMFDRVSAADKSLAARFSGWGDAPASAQAATLSMAYAMGAHALDGFPRFCAAFRAADWGTCALECRMDDSHNAGLRPRNSANQALFAAAADGGDPDAVPVVW